MDMSSLVLLLLSLVVFIYVKALPDRLRVDIDREGNYSVKVGDQIWLNSGPAVFCVNGRVYSTSGQGATILPARRVDNGSDSMGNWSAIYMTVKLDDSNSTTFELSVTLYQRPRFALFRQHFPNGAKSTKCSNDSGSLSSSFPSFRVDDLDPSGSKFTTFTTSAGSPPSLGYMALGGLMIGDRHRKYGRWGIDDENIVSGLESGPLVLFDGNRRNCLFVSPFDNFMASSAVYTGKHSTKDRLVSWGIMGGVEAIPVGFTSTTILLHSNQGINEAFIDWGQVMHAHYGKSVDGRNSDFMNNYLGYWTDRGAFYYYNTVDKNSTYEQTLLDIYESNVKANIPYRYMQYDSWFYFKGPKGGVDQWAGMPKLFPHGLKSVHDKTGIPVSAHNRWWSDHAVYAKQNGGHYDFIVEKQTSKALPVEERFWNDLMANATKWGLINYEQDWINTEFDGMFSLHADISLGRTWLLQMGRAASNHHVTIQYCMCPPRAALQSLEVEAVTQARVTDDYQPGNDNWKVGVSNLFADALGVAPFKDTFWTTPIQPSNPYNLSEANVELQSLVATLTTGPVGVSDAIGYSNKTLIMRSCNELGLLLKPSSPIKAIDDMIINRAYHNNLDEIWSTFTDLDPINRFSIVLVVQDEKTMNEKINIYPHQINLRLNQQKFISYDIFANILDFSETKPLTLQYCSRKHFCLRYISSVLQVNSNNFVLLGEMSKWVPVSSQRITSASFSPTSGLSLSVSGAPGEVVRMSYLFKDIVYENKVKLSNSGKAEIKMPF